MLVFHATGNGGQAMESLIADGLIAGVLDITTTELADELVGGVLSAGPDRLTAAGQTGMPQVVSVGATRHGQLPRAARRCPSSSQGRKFYQHNANVTLMRTTPEENAQLGEEIGRKVAAAKARRRSCCRCKASRPSTAPASRSTTRRPAPHCARLIRATRGSVARNRTGLPHQRSSVRGSHSGKTLLAMLQLIVHVSIRWLPFDGVAA